MKLFKLRTFDQNQITVTYFIGDAWIIDNCIALEMEGFEPIILN